MRIIIIMEYVSYINSLVHITLNDCFYYVGKIINADEQGINLIDKTGKKVFVSNSSVATIREVSDARNR